MSALHKRRWSPSQTPCGLVRRQTKNQRHRVQAICLTGRQDLPSVFGCLMHGWSFWIQDTLQMLTQWSVPHGCAEGTGLFLWRLPASCGLPCPVHPACMAQRFSVPETCAKLAFPSSLWLAEARNGKILWLPTLVKRTRGKFLCWHL